MPPALMLPDMHKEEHIPCCAVEMTRPSRLGSGNRIIAFKMDSKISCSSRVLATLSRAGEYGFLQNSAHSAAIELRLAHQWTRKAKGRREFWRPFVLIERIPPLIFVWLSTSPLPEALQGIGDLESGPSLHRSLHTMATARLTRVQPQLEVLLPAEQLMQIAAHASPPALRMTINSTSRLREVQVCYLASFSPTVSSIAAA